MVLRSKAKRVATRAERVRKNDRVPVVADDFLGDLVEEDGHRETSGELGMRLGVHLMQILESVQGLFSTPLAGAVFAVVGARKLPSLVAFLRVFW